LVLRVHTNEVAIYLYRKISLNDKKLILEAPGSKLSRYRSAR